MTVGEIFLESLSTGVITEHEVNWLASHQTSFDRPRNALNLSKLLLCLANRLRSLGWRDVSAGPPTGYIILLRELTEKEVTEEPTPRERLVHAVRN